MFMPKERYRNGAVTHFTRSFVRIHFPARSPWHIPKETAHGACFFDRGSAAISSHSWMDKWKGILHEVAVKWTATLSISIQLDSDSPYFWECVPGRHWGRFVFCVCVFFFATLGRIFLYGGFSLQFEFVFLHCKTNGTDSKNRKNTFLHVFGTVPKVLVVLF